MTDGGRLIEQAQQGTKGLICCMRQHKLGRALRAEGASGGAEWVCVVGLGGVSLNPFAGAVCLGHSPHLARAPAYSTVRMNYEMYERTSQSLRSRECLPTSPPETPGAHCCGGLTEMAERSPWRSNEIVPPVRIPIGQRDCAAGVRTLERANSRLVLCEREGSSARAAVVAGPVARADQGGVDEVVAAGVPDGQPS